MSEKAKSKNNLGESSHYYVAYGCERDPFSDVGISGLFFSGGEREKIVQELLHFARFTQSPALLLGKNGAGKSTILKQLLGRADRDIDIALVDVQIMQSDQQLLSATLRGFRQPVPQQVDLFTVFSQWVLAQNARQRYVTLCFDNVHNLTAEFLQPFFDLVASSESLFRLILAGEQESVDALQSLASQYEFALNTIDLPAFTEANVSGYALYRMRAAGYQSELPFTEIQLRAAQRRSNGNIAQLNALLRDMLIAGSDYHKHINFKYPRVNLALAVTLLLLIFFAAMHEKSDSDANEVNDELELRLGGTTPAKPPSAQPAAGEKPLVNAPPKPASIVLATQKSSTSEEEVSEPSASREEPSAGSNKEPSASTEEPSAGGNRESPASEKPPAAIAQEPQADERAGQIAVPIEQVSGSLVNELDGDGQVAESASNRQEAVWKRLQSWPEGGYALQVFGTHNALRARKLVEQYFGEADLLFYETRHNGKPWFVVISGPYSGRKAAQNSVALLPDSLQRLRPWPRNIASIRSDIQRYQSIVSPR